MLFWSGPFPIWSHCLFLVLLGYAMYSDLTLRKIPNSLNGSILVSGLILQIWIHGLEGLLNGFLGSLCALLILLVPFALYVYRGGDVKLCIGMGAWIGAKTVAFSILGGILLGGFFGLLMWIHYRLTYTKNSSLLTVPMAFPFCISCIGTLSIWGWSSSYLLW